MPPGWDGEGRKMTEPEKVIKLSLGVHRVSGAAPGQSVYRCSNYRAITGSPVPVPVVSAWKPHFTESPPAGQAAGMGTEKELGPSSHKGACV